MSGRVASHQSIRRPSRFPKSLRGLGLLAVVVLAGAVGGRGLAQDDIDDKDPLPPATPPRAQQAAKYKIENPNAAIFKGRKNPRTGYVEGGITDFLPIASEKQNSDEYAAWTAVIQHAKQFKASELEEFGARDLTRDDLTEATRELFRLDLVRLDGRLLKARRVPGTESLKLAGTAEIYEVLLLVPGDPPTDVVSVVVTELPEALAAVKQKPALEWVEFDLWAAAAGYSFKVKQDAPTEPAVPVLIGKSVTVLKGPPAPPGSNPAAIDKTLRVFRGIKDDARIAKADTNWEEVAAWHRVLLHARRFTPEELEKHAQTGVKFADLFLDNRKDYKLDLVKFEGRLISLKSMKPTPKLLAAGVENVYEGWLVPRDEPSGNPICVVFTDPPEGVEAVGRVNKWVSFAGYSFKKMRYESAEKDAKDPNKNVWKATPLLMGRAVVVRPDPEKASSTAWGEFALMATIVVVGLIAFGVGMSWWFRRTDRQARQEIEAHRSRNPFNESAN